MEKDEPTYEDIAWVNDIASLVLFFVAVLISLSLTALAFWALGWI